MQDQISAAFGGFNHITFSPHGAFQVNPMVLPTERLEALQSHLILVFTGVSRIANDIAQTQIDNFKNRRGELQALHEMVDEAVEILASPTADLAEFGRLLHRAWMLKRTLSTRVSNPRVDDLYDSALRAGAVGGKLLGAGGGGFMLLFVRPEDRARLVAAIPQHITVSIRFELAGSQIVLYQPNGFVSA